MEDLTLPVNAALQFVLENRNLFQSEISGGDATYPYKAYLETLLDYGDEAKNTQLVSRVTIKTTLYI